MKALRVALYSLVLITFYCIQAVPATFISPDQVSSGGFTISSRGLYVLTDDVAYSISNGTAISITTSDVILDLNGKSIVASNGANTAVSIGDALSNIAVKNGAARNFDSRGILVGTTAQNMTFEDLTLIGLNKTSASLGLSINGDINDGTNGNNIRVRNCYVTSFANGMTAAASALSILDSTFDNNRIGLAIAGNAVDIINCQASNNSGNSAMGLSADSGLAISGSSWRIKNSDFSFNINTAGGVSTSGAHLAIHNVEITNCSFNSNGGVGTVRGLDISGTNSCVIRNCTFNGNFSTSAAALRGLSLSGTGHYVENCIADANWTTALGGFAVTGIVVTGSAHTLVNCHAAGNASQATDNLGIGNGILVDSAAQRCLIKNCTAVSNSTAGFRDDSTAGSNLWIGNLSWGHGANNYVGAGPGFVAFAAGAQPPTGSFDERGIDNLSVL